MIFVLVVVACVAPPASHAAIWKSSNAEIPAGTNYKVLVEKKGTNANYILTTASLTINCSTQSNIKQSEIFGGSPGKYRGTLTLTGCTVTNPNTCQVKETNVGEVTLMIQGQLSEYESSPRHYLPIEYMLITSGQFRLENKGAEVCPNAITSSNPYQIRGTLLAQIKPELMERQTLQVIMQTPITRYRVNSQDCFGAVALSVITSNGTENATLTGESEIEEEGGTPKISFGAFL